MNSFLQNVNSIDLPSDTLTSWWQDDIKSFNFENVFSWDEKDVTDEASETTTDKTTEFGNEIISRQGSPRLSHSKDDDESLESTKSKPSNKRNTSQPPNTERRYHFSKLNLFKLDTFSHHFRYVHITLGVAIKNMLDDLVYARK